MFTIYKENGFYNVNLNLGSLTKDEVNTLCQKLIKLEVEFGEDIGDSEKEAGESDHKGDPNRDEEAGDVEDKDRTVQGGRWTPVDGYSGPIMGSMGCGGSGTWRVGQN